MAETIQAFRRADLDDDLRKQVDGIAAKEFGHIPIIRDTVWSSPNRHLILFSDDRPQSILSIVERKVLFDDYNVNIAGVANFITLGTQRQRGFGTRLLKSAQEFMRETLRLDSGLLLCSDDVTPFYIKQGWIKSRAQLTYDQPKGKNEWHKDVLIYPIALQCEPEKKIDLLGLPW